jgi:DNA-binding NarL/FixJ family response regulator
MSSDPRILIIEDHDVLRMMLFTVLRNQPLAVDTAVSADEAMEKVASCDYALILIDMGMAGSQGEEFLQRFREEKPEAPTFIIAVRDHTRETFIDPDIVSAVLSKPLEIDTLAQLVRECAILVPPAETEESGQCPPAESELRDRMDRGGPLVN